MSKLHNFKKDLKDSTRYYDQSILLLNNLFNSKFRKSGLEMDKLGSDIDNSRIYIDIKDNKYDSTNMIVEWGGWTTNKANITTYLLWITTDKVLLIDYSMLRNKCIKDKNNILASFGMFERTSVSENRTWNVQMSKVPMAYFKKCIAKDWTRTYFDNILSTTITDLSGRNDFAKLLLDMQ